MIIDRRLIDSTSQELTIRHLYTIDNYFTFNVKVRSGEFAGSSNFCMPIEYVVFVVEKVSEMLNKLDGNCIVKDYDSDAHLVFEMKKLGHMRIYGQIGGSHEEHTMKFNYTADQTVLADFLQMLKSLL